MSLFGTTLRQVGRDLRTESLALGISLSVEQLRAIMQIVVSLIVLGGGFYVLLNGSEQAGQAAAGAMGAVVGYWLR